MELAKRIIAENAVVVFSKTYCGYCTRVKGLFGSLGVKAYVIELDTRDDGDALNDYLSNQTKVSTVPKVFIGGEFIGGCDKTVALNSKGELVPKLKAAGAL